MSRTDHPRPAKRPEHSDGAPRHISRPDARRTRTRMQAVLRALRDLTDPGPD